MSFVFHIISSAFRRVAEVTGFSYEEINIIIYFFLIPAFFFFLIDRIVKRYVCSAIFLILSVGFFFFIPSFDEFSDYLFERCVDFLLWFSVVGWNYTVASVVICVILPLLVFIPLIHYAFPGFYRRYYPTVFKTHDSQVHPRA